MFSLGAAAVFVFLSWALTTFYLRQLPFAAVARGKPFASQAIVGLTVGSLLSGLVVLIVVRWRRMAAFRAFLAELLDRFRLTLIDMATISIAAGVSEELFFRGILQQMWGPSWSSFAFALSHVGGNVFSWSRMAYAIYLFVVGSVFGLLCQQHGLVAAIVAHSTFNLIFLLAVTSRLRVSAR
jgi:membrane protease YdiL (CAAX protease family)